MPQFKHARRSGRVCLLVAAAVASGCSEGEAPLLAPFADGVYSLSDARNGGNPHFLFLPPLARAMPPAAPFDPSLAAEVRVCVWDGAACVGDDVAYFAVGAADAAAVSVDAVEEQYSAHWHTKDAHGGTGLDPANTYRIQVLVGDYELGHADVRAEGRGRGLGSAYGRDAVSLNGQAMVVIRFRIEEGAVPSVSIQPMLVAGAAHTCALDAAGAARCWGANESGQLGDGTTENRGVPVAVGGGHVFTRIAAGGAGTCGLEADGSAWCWGGLAGGATQPQPVGGLAFSLIAAGAQHACGVAAADGRAWCWGDGAYGALGGGSYAGSAAPRLVSDLYAFSSLSAGDHHTCGRAAEGIVCWGRNAEGQLGRGTRTDAAPFGLANAAPAVPALGLTKVAAGGVHTCGLTATGMAWCWGAGASGQLGGGMPTMYATAPVEVAGGNAFASLTLGLAHSCGVTGTGTSLCWGSNGNGQLAIGFPGPMMPSPVSPYYAYEWTHLDAGADHNCGISATGELLCWGRGGSGQVGDGLFMDQAIQVPVALP